MQIGIYKQNIGINLMKIILKRLGYEFKEGEIYYGGLRHIITSPSYISFVKSYISAAYGAEKMKESMYNIGKEDGKKYGSVTSELPKTDNIEKFIDGIITSSQKKFWGHIDKIDVNEKRIILFVRNSIDYGTCPECCGENDTCCPMLAGLFAGLVTSFMGKNYDCEELVCGKQGGEGCLFLIARRITKKMRTEALNLAEAKTKK